MHDKFQKPNSCIPDRDFCANDTTWQKSVKIMCKVCKFSRFCENPVTLDRDFLE